MVSKIARLRVGREEFGRQARALMETNVVYSQTDYDAALVADWAPHPEVQTVPEVIVYCGFVVPRLEDAGTVRAHGPGDAIVGGEAEWLDVELEAVRQARYISAWKEQVRDLSGQEDDGSLEVVALINQLEELEKAAEKSVAAELKTLMEGGLCPLQDEVGRERILDMCRESRRSCQRLYTSSTLAKLQEGFAKVVAVPGGSSGYSGFGSA